MTTLLFIWYLVTTPSDKLACSLWVKQPPSAEALIAACGFNDLGKYRLDVIALDSRKLICSQPADALATIAQDCHLPEALDHYRLQIVQPDYSELVCSLALEHVGDPTHNDVAGQCPKALSAFDAGRLQIRFIGQQTKAPKEAKPIICAAPVLVVGPGLYQQADTAAALFTDDALTWLAGRLIWFGLAQPNCGGASGLDPETLAANGCGLASARSLVTRWQNQFNDSIFDAAQTYHVPARLLKKLLEVESQFWPMWSRTTGETGLMQVTENGADVLLRYDPSLDPEYPHRRTEEQYWLKLSTLNSFTCELCTLEQAVQHTRGVIPTYARLLAAYRCRAVEINPALSGDDAWRQAVIDYNGGEAYLRKVEQ